MTGDGDARDRRTVPDGGESGRSGTVPDGRYVAVLDRFEVTDPAEDGDDLAVMLLESGDEVVAERAIPAWRLPEEARRQDAVVKLAVSNGHVVSLSADPETTERRVDAAQSRFDRLADRPGVDSAAASESDSAGTDGDDGAGDDGAGDDGAGDGGAADEK